jgi:hypothetical protein
MIQSEEDMKWLMWRVLMTEERAQGAARRGHTVNGWSSDRRNIFQGCYDVWDSENTAEMGARIIEDRLADAVARGYLVTEIEPKYKKVIYKITEKGYALGGNRSPWSPQWLKEVDEFVLIHGEKYRKLIDSGLAFLDTHEPKWGLDEPMNRPEYIKNLIKQVKKN